MTINNSKDGRSHNTDRANSDAIYIAYRNRLSDIVIFQIQSQFYALPNQFLTLVFAGYIFTWRAKLYGAVAHTHEWFTAFSLSVACYVLIWLFQFLFNLFYFAAQPNRAIFTDHMLTIDTSALVEETVFNKSQYTWSGVERIKRYFHCTAIFISSNGAIVIPHRIFRSTDEIDRMHKLVHTYIDRAKLLPRRLIS